LFLFVHKIFGLIIQSFSWLLMKLRSAWWKNWWSPWFDIFIFLWLLKGIFKNLQFHFIFIVLTKRFTQIGSLGSRYLSITIQILWIEWPKNLFKVDLYLHLNNIYYPIHPIQNKAIKAINNTTFMLNLILLLCYAWLMMITIVQNLYQKYKSWNIELISFTFK
jgi:hypothetical protein